jgi:hypothetical protein
VFNLYHFKQCEAFHSHLSQQEGTKSGETKSGEYNMGSKCFNHKGYSLHLESQEEFQKAADCEQRT